MAAAKTVIEGEDIAKRKTGFFHGTAVFLFAISTPSITVFACLV